MGQPSLSSALEPLLKPQRLARRAAEQKLSATHNKHRYARVEPGF